MTRSDVTQQAKEGYAVRMSYRGDGVKSFVPVSPYLKTSNADSAWQIGAWMAASGRTEPHDCRPSRGDTFHINGMKVKLVWNWNGGSTQIERLT